MDVFALTSEAEGHPLSLIEAMASGLGCVVSDFEGCEEIIRPGVDALQFPRGDVQALAERVRKFHGEEQLRGRCGQAARQKVLEKFSEKATARSVAEVYEELLGMKPAPKSGG
jgi:glycosyltransferase involved in cell wall biosynthesis